MLRKISFLFLTLVGLLSIALYNNHQLPHDTVFAKEGPFVGSAAPDFSLPDLSGDRVNLQNVIRSHNVTVLNFWATWCPPCRAEIPEFNQFYQKYNRQHVAVVGVNLQEKPEDVRSFVRTNRMNFTILIDRDGKVGNTYQIYAIPTTFFIDSQGIIRGKIEGSTSMSVLESKVNAILKGN